MSWYAVIEDATNRLVSVGTVIASPLPAGLVAELLPSKPSGNVMWDETTRAFIARPPKVLVDRLQDLLANSDFADVWRNLNAARRTKIRNALIWLLGRARWRNQTESSVIDPEV